MIFNLIERNGKYFVKCFICGKEFSYLTKYYAEKHEKIKGKCPACEDVAYWKVSKETKKAYKEYDREVRRLTEITFIENRESIYNSDKRAFMGYHLDHILPIKWGFKHRIPPIKMASLDNLQMLTREDNYKKGDILKPESAKLLCRFIEEISD